MLELYNEQLRDLLAPGGPAGSRGSLSIVDDPRTGVRVAGLWEQVRCAHGHSAIGCQAGGWVNPWNRGTGPRWLVTRPTLRPPAPQPVADAKSALALVARGSAARSVGSTAMNEVSSRSHTVVRLALETREGERAACRAGAVGRWAPWV